MKGRWVVRAKVTPRPPAELCHIDGQQVRREVWGKWCDLPEGSPLAQTYARRDQQARERRREAAAAILSANGFAPSGTASGRCGEAL